MSIKGEVKEGRQDIVFAFRGDKVLKSVIEQFAKENDVSVAKANWMLVNHGINYYYNIKGE